MPKTELRPFEQALLDATLEEFEDIPSEEEIDLTFSSEFEEKGEQLVMKSRRGAVYYLSTTAKRAILIAAIVAALAITALAIPTIRESIIKFFTHDEGTHFEFSFDPEQAATAPEYIEKAYVPSYIPESFKEDTAIVNERMVTYIWVSDSGDYITFDQCPIPDKSDGPQPDAEDVTTETICLNGYEVFCVHGEITMYHWTDNEYFYQMCFGSSVSVEEQHKIFYSIAKDEDIVPVK